MTGMPKDLDRQIDWLINFTPDHYWTGLSITSIKELRWALENPKIWANK